MELEKSQLFQSEMSLLHANHTEKTVQVDFGDKSSDSNRR